jgi:hypothetical protein
VDPLVAAVLGGMMGAALVSLPADLYLLTRITAEGRQTRAQIVPSLARALVEPNEDLEKAALLFGRRLGHRAGGDAALAVWDRGLSRARAWAQERQRRGDGA